MNISVDATGPQARFVWQSASAEIRERAPLTDKNMQAFQEALAIKNPQIEKWNLRECDFTNSSAFQALLDLITQNTYSGVTELDLGACKFANKHDFSRLLQALSSNQHFTRVGLSNYVCSDYLSQDGSLSLLLKANSTIQSLDLSGHSLEMEHVVDLTQGLNMNSTLQSLTLHSCYLDDVSATVLMASALVQDSLKTLDLGASNSFTPNFLNTIVANYLRETKSLQTLVLDHSGSMFECSAAEIKPFIKALRSNKTLKSLSLRYCRLSEAQGEAILTALTINDTLRSLDLEFTGFGLRDRGNEILIRVLPKWKGLQTLRLLTHFSEHLAPALIGALQRNSSLHHFSPRVTRKALGANEQVQALLQRNQQLSHAACLVNQSSTISPSVLPNAMARLSSTTSGAAATFQVLSFWAGDCV